VEEEEDRDLREEVDVVEESELEDTDDGDDRRDFLRAWRSADLFGCLFFLSSVLIRAFSSINFRFFSSFSVRAALRLSFAAALSAAKAFSFSSSAFSSPITSRITDSCIRCSATTLSAILFVSWT